MREDIPAFAVDEVNLQARSRAFETIAAVGLTVGVLDGLAASTNAAVRGISPSRVFQYVASALLGGASFSGGSSTVLLGILLHFLVAFIVTIIYYGASRRFPALVRHAIVSGIAYGIIVYFVMGYLVVPLTAASKIPFSFVQLVIGIITHIFCIGLPIALLTRRFALKSQNKH